MKFARIKVRPKIEVEYYSQVNESSAPDVIRIKSEDIPAPEFMSAFGSLRSVAIKMIDLPAKELENIQADELIIKEKSGREYFSIKGTRYLKGTKLTMEFTTPSLPTEHSDPDLQLPKGAYDTIQSVMDHATEYMKGKRAQLNIFSIEVKSA